MGANVDWTIEADGLEWLSISPMHGKRDRRTTVTLIAQDNVGRSDRSGSLILHSEGVEDKTMSIVQDKLSSTLVVGGADGGRLAFSPVGEALDISIIANVPWSISTIGADWLSVSPSSGDGDNSLTPKTVSLTAESNPGPPRTGTLTVASADGDVEPIAEKKTIINQADIVFTAYWADGNPDRLTRCRLYFGDSEGNVYRQPYTMKSEWEKPVKIDFDRPSKRNWAR